MDLRPGDLLALGAVTSRVSLESDTDIAGIEAQYFGLDGEDSIDLDVSFELPETDD